MPLYNDPIQENQTYEDLVRVDLDRWVLRLLKRPGLLERTSKVLQTKVRDDLGTVGMNCYRLRIAGGTYFGEGHSTRD